MPRCLVVSVFALALAACSGASQTGATAAAEVEVTLKDFAIQPAEDSVAAGNVTFRATNAGPSYPHELIIVKADVDLAALPTTTTGMLDQRAAGIEVVAEIDEMTQGESGESTVNLVAGKYILVCNIYDDAGAHFQQGMLTSFTVTD